MCIRLNTMGAMAITRLSVIAMLKAVQPLWQQERCNNCQRKTIIMQIFSNATRLSLFSPCLGRTAGHEVDDIGIRYNCLGKFVYSVHASLGCLRHWVTQGVRCVMSGGAIELTETDPRPGNDVIFVSRFEVRVILLYKKQSLLQAVNPLGLSKKCDK